MIPALSAVMSATPFGSPTPPFYRLQPDTTDKTIHEFPYYSFLVADLHAHVINLAFVLLLIALLVRLLSVTACSDRPENADNHRSIL